MIKPSITSVETELRKFKLCRFDFLKIFLVAIPGFLSLDKISNQLASFVKNDTLYSRPKRSDLYTLS